MPHTDPVPPNTSQYRPILTQYHHIWYMIYISLSLGTWSFATVSLATIVLCDKFYNKLRHKKPRIIIQIRELHCLLGLVQAYYLSWKYMSIEIFMKLWMLGDPINLLIEEIWLELVRDFWHLWAVPRQIWFSHLIILWPLRDITLGSVCFMTFMTFCFGEFWRK